MSDQHFVYAPADVQRMDRLAIEAAGMPPYTLMSRAGHTVYRATRRRCPDAQRWLVLCGAGNNAGDGYVVARLAREVGIDVRVAALSDPDGLRGAAAQAWSMFREGGGQVVDFDARLPGESGVVIDALLGTGLDRPVEGAWQDAINAVNAAGVPVVAVDIPSGLNAQTGQVMGAAIVAVATATFVGRKAGLYLGSGPDHCGEIVFDDLGIPRDVVADVSPALRLFEPAELAALLPPRSPTAHKGQFGHVLVVGGNHGMGGAVRMAGEAALRSGAGLVTVATRPDNVAAVTAGRPELMCHGIREASDLEPLMHRPNVIAFGPGLGRDDWARGLFARVLRSETPKVLDADALNLLADKPAERNDWILTPHPGEAARLLDADTAAVQADRLGALEKLGERYGGVTVLKGRGTLVGMPGGIPYLIDAGNPAMASAGMGDVLTGLVAGLLAQAPGYMHRSAAAAAFVHAKAGDLAARGDDRGILATDLLDFVRPCLNPGS